MVYSTSEISGVSGAGDASECGLTAEQLYQLDTLTPNAFSGSRDTHYDCQQCPLCAAGCGDQGIPSGWGSQVIAERFRTKMCAKWVATNGYCPYESRCMFAHGAHELRTLEANLRDGLTSADAIRDFKAAIRQKARRRAAKRQRHRRNRALAAINSQQQTPWSEESLAGEPSQGHWSDGESDKELEALMECALPRERPPVEQRKVPKIVRWYSHDPYFPVLPTDFDFGIHQVGVPLPPALQMLTLAPAPVPVT